MNATEPVIQTALLGTANKEFVPGELPEALATLIRKIQEISEDPESALYQTAAATFAYRRAGWEPLSAKDIPPIQAAPEEHLPYFDSEQNALFARLESTSYLLLHAYRKAVASRRLIVPELLPPLIRRAFDRNNPNRNAEQALLARLAGNRGCWLLPHLGFTPWGKMETEAWDTASHNERKEILRQCRHEHPAQALEMLRNEWKSESAVHRDELLGYLRINLSKADETFLQEVAESDRSSTVKETARNLLCRMPESEQVKRYCEWLQEHLRYNALTGWSYKKPAYTPEMKKFGLEEVSPNKKEKDEEYLLRQLAQRVPLTFWCEFFGCDAEQAARRLARHQPFRKFFNLQEPIVNFSDSQWACYTLKEDPSYIRQEALVGLLTPAQREEIALPEKWENFNFIPTSWFNEDGKPWGPRFSEHIVSWLLQNRYLYYVNDTAEHLALYLDPSQQSRIEQHLSAITEEAPSILEFCTKTSEYMSLKTAIDTLFNDNQ